MWYTASLEILVFPVSIQCFEHVVTIYVEGASKFARNISFGVFFCTCLYCGCLLSSEVILLSNTHCNKGETRHLHSVTDVVAQALA